MASAIFYPKILLSQRKPRAKNRLHLLITHMTVLSTTNIDRVSVFRTWPREDEYGELAIEMRRIVQLVDTWNQPRRRLSSSRPAGPEPRSFGLLRPPRVHARGGTGTRRLPPDEQEQIVQHYSTVYESSLGSLEVMKDLYLSMILSMTFASSTPSSFRS